VPPPQNPSTKRDSEAFRTTAIDHALGKIGQKVLN
jgi:hypothetical protein